jgi:mannose-6-phosphate isomerase-like protein (cupin superfamily)
MTGPLDLIDLMQRAKALSGSYENVVLAEINDHVIRISLMTQPYFWHLHPDSDETFIGLEGVVIIELAYALTGDSKYHRVELRPGQLFTVPTGVRHRTAPAHARSVNLTIERAGIQTLRLDDPAT